MFGGNPFGVLPFGGTESAAETSLVIAEASHSHTSDNLSFEASLTIADSTHAHSSDNCDVDFYFPTGWTKLLRLEIRAAFVMESESITNYKVKVVGGNIHTDFFAACLNGGGDVYASSDPFGVNRLAVKITSFDTVAETADLEVLIPVVNNNYNTAFYLWGGNAGASQPGASEPYGADAVTSAITDPAATSTYTNNTNLPNQFIISHLPQNIGSDTVLQTEDSAHPHTSDNIIFPGGSLVIQDSSHSQTADNLSIIAHLNIQDAVSAHLAENVAIVPHVGISDCLHGHTSDAPWVRVPVEVLGYRKLKINLENRNLNIRN